MDIAFFLSEPKRTHLSSPHYHQFYRVELVEKPLISLNSSTSRMGLLMFSLKIKNSPVGLQFKVRMIFIGASWEFYMSHANLGKHLCFHFPPEHLFLLAGTWLSALFFLINCLGKLQTSHADRHVAYALCLLKAAFARN